MNKFQEIYESFIKENNEEIKALLQQKRNLQDAVRNNPGKYPEENKINQEKIKVTDQKIKLSKEKEIIADEEEKIQDQINRLNKKKAQDMKNNNGETNNEQI